MAYPRAMTITNLPSGITTGILLDALEADAPFGEKVWDTRMLQPERVMNEKGGFDDHARRRVLLEMWSYKGATAVYNFITKGKLRIDGLVAKCEMQQVSRTRGYRRTWNTRVLVIFGDPLTADQKTLKDWIRKVMRGLKVWFDQQSMNEYVNGAEHAVVWQFSGILNAENAFRVLDNARKKDEEISIRVHHGTDSFAVGAEKALKKNLRGLAGWEKIRIQPQAGPSTTRQIRSRRKWILRNFVDGKPKKREAGEGEAEAGEEVPFPFWPGIEDSTD